MSAESRGVNVRMTGRWPSARRNSFPFQVGMMSSREAGDGNNSRTLAAGSSIAKPSSSAPPSVTRARHGFTIATRRTSTMRNRGGSRRTRTLITVMMVRMEMPHRPLGQSGLEVSRLSLGSWRTFERIGARARSRSDARRP